MKNYIKGLSSINKIYESMKPMFDIVAHDFQKPSKPELDLLSQFSDNTFEKRIVGFNRLIKYRYAHPKDTIVLVSNHLSETDFIETMIQFLRHEERLLIQGGDNLFIEDFRLSNPFLELKIDLNKYLRSRGAFQVIRKPKVVEISEDSIELNKRDVVKLNKCYLFNLVKEGETFLQYPGQSNIEGTLKQGRTYNGMTESFSRSIFQLLIEGKAFAKNEIHIAPVNISYESIFEDTIFSELLKMKADGKNDDDIYLYDMKNIIDEYMNPDRKARMCLKFSEPKPIQVGLSKKATSKKLAAEYYDKVMSMQTPFPANIFFTASQGIIDVKDLEERIGNLTERLYKNEADMYYLMQEGKLKSPSRIIDETLDIYEPRGIVTLKNNKIKILRNDVAEQYANHISYILQDK